MSRCAKHLGPLLLKMKLPVALIVMLVILESPVGDTLGVSIGPTNVETVVSGNGYRSPSTIDANEPHGLSRSCCLRRAT